MKSTRLYSPRSTGSKQLASTTLTGLNSYKIDTSSLQQKARQVQHLKNQLQTQISQYKQSELIFHEQKTQLKQENKELKGKIKKIQTELNKVKADSTQKSTNKVISQSLNNLNVKITQLQSQITKLEKKIKKKDEYILELQEYKKMYEIEVQNKNNIMNFYQTKLDGFKKDKITLISKYQEKISVLGSGLDINATIIQVAGINPKANMQKITAKSSQNVYKSPQRTYEHQNELQASKRSQNNLNPSRGIKMIRTSGKNVVQNNRKGQPQIQTPYKLLKINSEKQFHYETPVNNSHKHQQKDLSISSASSLKKDVFRSNKNVGDNTKIHNENSDKLQANDIERLKASNYASNAKSLRNNDSFLTLMRQITANLRRQNLKSQNLKNFNSIRSFDCIPTPTQSQLLELLQSFPLAPIQMNIHEIELCIDKMKKHLIRKYSTFSGNLLIQLIIDKVQDFQIAFQVNSEDQGQIIAGLSSYQEDD